MSENADAPENIVSVNLEQRRAFTESGEMLPVTNMIDEDGDETEDPSECVAFVCGPTSYGLWLVDEVAHFEFGKALN